MIGGSEDWCVVHTREYKIILLKVGFSVDQWTTRSYWSRVRVSDRCQVALRAPVWIMGRIHMQQLVEANLPTRPTTTFGTKIPLLSFNNDRLCQVLRFYVFPWILEFILRWRFRRITLFRCRLTKTVRTTALIVERTLWIICFVSPLVTVIALHLLLFRLSYCCVRIGQLCSYSAGQSKSAISFPCSS